MLLIKAESPAGLTIKQAIGEALILSNRIGCMVQMEINDIPMVFIDSLVHGSTFEERVKNYHAEWERKFKEKNNV